MFYKHWKTILLSALALLWSGCENEDSAVAGYGCLPTVCYNSTATNDSGKVFDIIECEDGYKYLREPGHYMFQTELQKELPEGVDPYRPSTGSCYATNCKNGSKICVKGSFTEKGIAKDYKHCDSRIECPEKPEEQSN